MKHSLYDISSVFRCTLFSAWNALLFDFEVVIIWYYRWHDNWFSHPFRVCIRKNWATYNVMIHFEWFFFCFTDSICKLIQWNLSVANMFCSGHLFIADNISKNGWNHGHSLKEKPLYSGHKWWTPYLCGHHFSESKDLPLNSGQLLSINNIHFLTIHVIITYNFIKKIQSRTEKNQVLQE